MSDLIVHIGLPKAGSTTIQNKLLKNEVGYLGQLKNLEKEKDFGKQLRDIAIKKLQTKDKEKELDKWYKNVHKYIKSECPKVERVIVSYEGFSRRISDNEMDKWPISFNNVQMNNNEIFDCLYTLSKKIWTSGEMKILLILRNQPDWLASLYAQISKVAFNASQEDFERRINNMIERNDEFLDWSKWLERLYYYFGKKNVCVLLLEDMSTKQFWERLTSFMKIDASDICERDIKDVYANKRRHSECTWTIPPIRPIKYIKTNWKHNTNKLYYKSILNATRLASSFIDITRFDRKRDRQIELNENLRSRILEYCRPFNERLEKQLGINLKERGYL